MSTYASGGGTYGGTLVPLPEPPVTAPPGPLPPTAKPLVPQFSLPFRLADTDFAYSEQDTNTEIADAVQAVVRYPVGYRIEKPQFGIVEQEFRMAGADTAHIQAQIDRWEPRADEITTGELEELLARVKVDVKGGQM